MEALALWHNLIQDMIRKALADGVVRSFGDEFGKGQR